MLFRSHFKGAPVNAKDQNGNTPLKWAEHKGHQDVVNYLGAKGAGMDMYQQVVSEMYNAAFDRLMRKKNMMTHEKFNKAWSSLEKKRDEAIRKSNAVYDNIVKTINGGKSAGNTVYQSREPDSANTIVTFSPFGSATDDDELQAEINTRRQANQAWQINENETQAILNRQRNENETQANQARQRHEAESRARERESKQWQLSQKASRLESDIDRASFSRSQGDLGKLSRKASSLSREASMHGYMSAASKFRKAANELDRQDFKDRFPSQSTDPFAVNRAKESVTSGRSSLNSFDNNSFSK